MGLTRIFKMANYLRRDKGAFHAISMDYRSCWATLPETDQMELNEDCRPEAVLTHPEGLLEVLTYYVDEDTAWDGMLVVLRRSMRDFNVADLEAHDLEKLEKYDRRDDGETRRVVLDALSGLSEADLDMVKLLLSWEIVSGHASIPRDGTEKSNPSRLTEQIFAKHSDHAAYVMSLIFAQIQRPDLVNRLTEATRLPWDHEAVP